MKKCNNKGTTLINVIITCGFIGILCAVILLATAGNLFIKKVDRESKNNFYTAETVVKEIEMGLQEEIANCMVDVYYTALTKGASDNDTFKKLVKEGYSVPAIGYAPAREIEGFIKKIVDSHHVDEIDKDNLMSYVDSKLKSKTTISGLDSGKIRYDSDPTSADFIIKGLDVKLQRDDYLSEISTDINIVIPNMPNKAENKLRMIDELKKYAIIADKSVAPYSQKNYIIKGNIWAGKGDATDKGGIQVNASNTTLDMSDKLCNRIFSEGEVSVAGNEGAKTTIGSKTEANRPTIAVGGFRVAKATGTTDTDENLDVYGNCYVQNDLTLDAIDGNAKMQGSYFGFGVGERTTEHPGEFYNQAINSSSISVNGRNSTLDMILDSLTLKGRAYVSTGAVNNATTANSLGINSGVLTGADILTGESITIRGNQIAYLVPFSHTPFIGNPISKSEYEAYISKMRTKQGKTEAQVKEDIIESINDNLRKDPIISEYIDDARPFIATYYSTTGASSDGVIYYYLNFKNKVAATDYYKTQVLNNLDSPKLNKDYFAKFIPVNKISIVSPIINISGNYITTANQNTQELTEGDDVTYAEADASGLFTNMRAYYSTEVPADVLDTYEDPTEKPNTTNNAIYNTLRILDPSSVTKVGLKSYPEGTTIIDDANVQTSKGKARVVVIRNSTVYTVPNNFKGLVIATGDVKLAGSMTGLVLTCGKVLFEANGTITADVLMMDDIFGKSSSIKTVKVGTGKTLAEHTLKDFFKVAIPSVTNNVTTKKRSISTDDDLTTSLDGMFTYSNWKKVQDS